MQSPHFRRRLIASRLFVRHLWRDLGALETWEIVGLMALLFGLICVVQFVLASA